MIHKKNAPIMETPLYDTRRNFHNLSYNNDLQLDTRMLKIIYSCLNHNNSQCLMSVSQLYLKKYILWMKIYYPNKIRSHLVTIVPMVPFTTKSTSKLRSALHFSRYSIVISRLFPALILLNPNNHYNHGFHNTFDYNHFMTIYYTT